MDDSLQSVKPTQSCAQNPILLAHREAIRTWEGYLLAFGHIKIFQGRHGCALSVDPELRDKKFVEIALLDDDGNDLGVIVQEPTLSEAIDAMTAKIDDMQTEAWHDQNNN